MLVVWSGSARLNGPVGLLPTAGGGGGATNGARLGPTNQGFFAGACQQTKASRPPGAAPRLGKPFPRGAPLVDLGHDEADVCSTPVTSSLRGVADQRNGDIATHHRPRRADPLGGCKRGGATTAPDVNNPLASDETDGVQEQLGHGAGQLLTPRPHRGPVLVVPTSPFSLVVAALRHRAPPVPSWATTFAISRAIYTPSQ